MDINPTRDSSLEPPFHRLPGRGAEYGVSHVEIDRDISVIPLLRLVGDISEARAVELIWLGAVYQNDHRLTESTTSLSAGDRVRVHFEPRRFQFTENLLKGIVKIGGACGSEIDFIVVDKPGGLPTHAQVDNARENLIAILESQMGQTGLVESCALAEAVQRRWNLHTPERPIRFLITHRLDVETNGLLLLATSAQAQVRLNQGLANKTITRLYRAWVERPIATGQVRHFMKPSKSAPKILSESETPGSRECLLKILKCEKDESYRFECGIEDDELCDGNPSNEANVNHRLDAAYRVTIELQTGRSQQIRAQLAHLGSPILGDQSYGSRSRFRSAHSKARAIALRAYEIRIVLN